MKTHASIVSRALCAAGFRTVSDHKRQGMRVRVGILDDVTVIAQMDTEPIALRRATEAADLLRSLGYTVEQRETHLRVTREAR